MNLFAALGAIALLIAALYGYVVNIIAVVGADFGTFTGLLVARLIGIVMPLLGAILGYV